MNYYDFRLLPSLAVTLIAALLIGMPSLAFAEFTAPGLVKDINVNLTGQADRLAADPAAEGENFSPGHHAFASASGSPYGLDQEGALNGNDLLVLTQGGASAGDGAGFTISVSNGENGDGLSGYCASGDCSITGTNPSNSVAADPVFNAIGNTSGRLEDGNVIRFSTWVRSDPNAPFTVEPQIAPIIKLEFWRDALSGHADFTGGVSNPNFGSRIFDTDQNDVAISDPAGRKRILDIDGNGSWTFGTTTEPVPSTSDWQQIVHTYEVDSIGEGWDIDPFGTDPENNPDQVEDVTFVEEIRGVLFMGDFDGGSLGETGNLLWDNALIEIFKDTTTESASNVLTSNPSPLLDEVSEDPDFDNDQDVDGTDYLIWQRGFGVGTQQFEGDADFSGAVNGDDLAIWQNSYAGGALSATSSVPEPTSALLALVGAVCLSGAIRRR